MNERLFVGALVLCGCRCPEPAVPRLELGVSSLAPRLPSTLPDPTRGCRRVTDEPCRAGAPQRATQTPDEAHALSAVGDRVFYNGQPTDFDAATFRFASVDGCAPHGNVYAWDANNVYLLSPQSCGANGCGDDYTGYYWSPLGVSEPSSFRWLAGGYATDGRNIYNQWNHGPVGTSATADELEVFLCGEGQRPFAHDGERWFEDGRSLDGFPSF